VSSTLFCEGIWWHSCATTAHAAGAATLTSDPFVVLVVEGIDVLERALDHDALAQKTECADPECVTTLLMAKAKEKLEAQLGEKPLELMAKSQ
jgi:hypothetical protein